MDAAPSSHRSLLSGAVSLVVHGGLIFVALSFVPDPVSEPRWAEITPIEVVELAPSTPPVTPIDAAGGALRAGPAGRTGAVGRHGDASPRSQTQPPGVRGAFADLTVSYDTPVSTSPGAEAGATGATFGGSLLGTGLGIGDGPGGYGAASLRVPPAPPAEKPPVSLARPPRPKRDYRTWEYHAGVRGTVLLELTIDPRGRVRNVRVVEGVDDVVDKRASDTARHFEFFPALNPSGDPTWGIHRWEFEIKADSGIGFHFGRR